MATSLISDSGCLLDHMTLAEAGGKDGAAWLQVAKPPPATGERRLTVLCNSTSQVNDKQDEIGIMSLSQ